MELYVQAYFRNVLRSMYSTWKSGAIIFDIFHRDVAHSCSLSYRYFLALCVAFPGPLGRQLINFEL